MIWFGIIGLVLITAGILIHQRELEDIMYIAGGLSLLVYSISINDMVFIILQVIFVVAAGYDFVRMHWFEH